jgi:hypothetical protein
VNGKLVVTPIANAYGTITVTVDAIANGQTVTRTFDVNITSVDDAPILTTIANPDTQEEDFADINITLSSTDAEDDNATFSVISNDKVTASISGNILTIKSIPNKYGEANVTVKVTQDNNATLYDAQTIAFGINPVNDTPTFTTNLTSMSILEDNGTINFEINANDIESDELNITVDSNNSSIITVSKGWNGLQNLAKYSQTLQFNLSTVEDAYGSVAITIMVNDGDKNTTQTFELNVTAVDDAPTLLVPNQTIQTNSGDFNITLGGSDKEGDGIVYTFANQNSDLATVTLVNGILQVSPIVDAFGVITVEVNASANGLVTTQIFTIEISPVGATDFDNDGTPDYLDNDDDNDWIEDSIEGASCSKNLDCDSDGILDSVEGSIDTDNDGKMNSQDTDSDNDGISDTIEGTSDDDLDGILNYIDGKNDGSQTPFYNNDGTETSTFKKVAGSGDNKVTSVTVPNGMPMFTYENSDKSSQVSFTDPSATLDIRANGSIELITAGHTLNVVNSGADINVTEDKNIILSIPMTLNSDGSTCQYTMELSYTNQDMVTKHILNRGLDNEIITTVIMKIPNSSIEIDTNNIVKHLGNFSNANGKDLNVTGLVNCKGEVSTTTTIKQTDTNTTSTFVAVNKAGSTVIIDANGDVDTTSALEIGETPTTLKGLNFKIDSDTGDINASKVYKDSSSDEVTYSDAQTYVAGAVLTTTGESISEVNVDLSDTTNRTVTVDVNSSGTIIESQTVFATNLNPTRTSSGETGAVTTQATSQGATIVIDNFLDGKAKHSVVVGGVSTEATSTLEGADVNVTSSGVKTTYQGTNLTAQVEATTSGIATHKMTTASGTTEATSQIIGAKTTIAQDNQGKAKVETKVSTTNSNNQAVEIQVDASSDGSAIHRVVVNGVETKATSQMAGAKTTIKTTGEVETNSTIGSTTASVRALADGTATHTISLSSGKESKATSKIKGATTVIGTTGDVETKVTQNNVEVTVATNKDGETTTSFDSNTTLADGYSLPIGNSVTIESNNGSTQIITVTPLEDNIKF